MVFANNCTHPALGAERASVAWRTCCIEFDYQAGWQRHPRRTGSSAIWARVWVGRTTRRCSPAVDRPGRIRQIAPASQAGVPANHSASGGMGSEASICGVPPAHEGSVVDRARSGRPKSAGLELDLSNARNANAFPSSFAMGYPAWVRQFGGGPGGRSTTRGTGWRGAMPESR